MLKQAELGIIKNERSQWVKKNQSLSFRKNVFAMFLQVFLLATQAPMFSFYVILLI